ncbi:EamA family transporter [Christiangramia fulva]|uniref:EamA family transporter n=1 Tax=Christiangramia fulva TaxID=2126553 RepID=A0A2R3Z7W5_9FLAO|nr:DMT family transporter [Christiangramia fulva]AVR46356.1 EamA family transporter [Christiangramia fulva]
MTKKAIYAVVICALIAGTNGVFIKEMTSMSTGLIAWFRAVVPVLFLLPAVWRKGGLELKGNYKHMILASFINAGRMFLYLIAYKYTSIGNAVVLFYSYPIFVTAIESLYYKKPIHNQQWLFLFLAFTGILVTYAGKPFSFESDDFIGMLAALGAAVGYAITVMMFKKETHNYSQNQIVMYQNIAGAVVFLPFLSGLPSAEISHMGIGLVYGLVIGVVVFKLFFFGLKFLPAATATSLMYLEVVSAILFGYLILNEKLSWNTYVGGAFILISSFYISRLNRKQSQFQPD